MKYASHLSRHGRHVMSPCGRHAVPTAPYQAFIPFGESKQEVVIASVRSVHRDAMLRAIKVCRMVIPQNPRFPLLRISMRSEGSLVERVWHAEPRRNGRQELMQLAAKGEAVWE